jgi:PAS domain S-box-containing protein
LSGKTAAVASVVVLPAYHETETAAEREPSLVLLIGLDGRIVGALGDTSALTGFDTPELLGRPAVDVLKRAGIAIDLSHPGVWAIVTNEHVLEVRFAHARVTDPIAGVLVLRDATRPSLASQVCVDELLLRQLPGVTWTTNRELVITHALGQMERNLGMSAEQVVGLSITEFARTREPTDPAIVAHHAALRGERSTLLYELRDRWYDVSVEPLRDEDGDIIGTIGAAVDATSRTRLEHVATERQGELVRTLQRNVSLLEATFDATADGLLVVDRSGKVVAYNKRFAAMWHIPTAIVDRRDDRELLAFVTDQLEDGQTFLDGVSSLYEQPEAESLDRLRFKDGTVFERYSRPQWISDRIEGRVWSFRDVTDAERALRHARFLSEASRLLTSLELGAALDGVARLAVAEVADACTVDVEVDGKTRRIASVARDPAISTPAPYPASVLAGGTWVGDVAGRAQICVPLTAIHATGILGALTVTVRGATMSVHDTELFQELARRCTAALENASLHRRREEEIRAREEFLAVVAHEFLGPLTTLNLTMDAFHDGLVQPEKLEATTTREIHRMQSFVDEMLDAGRLRAGTLRFQLETVDLVAVTRSVAERMSMEVARSGSTLTIEAPPQLVGRWDGSRVDQLVTNLLSNALKFGRGRPIQITISTRDDLAILEVTDHGIGIAPEVRTSIFEPFARAIPFRQYGGLGLGLYIVRRIVESLDGRIAVKSVPGESSTFSVELPLEPKR